MIYRPQLEKGRKYKYFNHKMVAPKNFTKFHSVFVLYMPPLSQIYISYRSALRIIFLPKLTLKTKRF